MLRAVKIRLYPSSTQAIQYNKLLGCYRVVYNQCLNRKIETYKNNGTSENLTTLGHYVHHELLKDDNFIWLREQNTKVLKQAVKDMLSAYNNFFKRHSGFPKFKSKHNNKQSCRFELVQYQSVMFIQIIKFLLQIYEVSSSDVTGNMPSILRNTRIV